MASTDNVCNEHRVMKPQIKICGLTRPEDVESAVRYGADYLGFIVEAKSSRKLTIAGAAKLSLPAKPAACTVAVVVNPDDELLVQIAEHMQPDYIQLHGDETPERAAAIKAKYGIKTIKALPVSSKADLTAISEYGADLMLLDAKPPKGAARGGHGTAFDWDILKGANLPDLWALAGGINPSNAAIAASRTHAPILDISSGVEARPGIKDASKIEALMNAVKHGQAG